ncbi:MAG: hypothetical protein K2Q23_02015, partial [Bryobacteraceae bacterium]|nr:hypothetical protein [Bryobacteraceae bacterium]
DCVSFRTLHTPLEGKQMQTLVIAPVKFVIQLVATLVVCAFLFGMLGGMGSYLSGNHCYRPRS